MTKTLYGQLTEVIDNQWHPLLQWASPIGRMEHSREDICEPAHQSWTRSFAQLDASGTYLGCRLKLDQTFCSSWSGSQLHTKLVVACSPEIFWFQPGDFCSSQSCWWWRPEPESSRTPGVHWQRSRIDLNRRRWWYAVQCARQCCMWFLMERWLSIVTPRLFTVFRNSTVHEP